MAYNTGRSVSYGRNNDARGIPEDQKAQGYLNIYLRRKNGGKAKIVGQPLRLSSEVEKQILDWLFADEKGKATKDVDAAKAKAANDLPKYLVIEFNSTAPVEGSELAFD